MLEFAVAAAVILPIFAGSFQFGYSYYVYNNLETSVRSASRYAATSTYNSASSTPSAAYTTAVQNMAVYGNPTGGTTPIAPGLTTANVRVSMRFESGAPKEVTVAITNYRIDGIFGAITLQGKPGIAFPYVGRWAPV